MQLLGRNVALVVLRSLTKKPFPTTRCFSVQAQETKKYRYTLNSGNGLLSEKQRDFYEDNGYIIIKGLVSDRHIEKYWARFDDLASGRLKPSPGLILQKEVSVAKKQQNANTLYKVQELYADEVFFQYCTNANLLDYVQCFTGPNIHVITTMLINKPPDVGNKSSRHPLHQDLQYFPIRPVDQIVGVWTAMEKIHRDNGCLVAVPGTHKGELLEHDYPEWEGGVNKFYYGIKDLSCLENRVHLEMERGDTIFFHPTLIHGSGINRTTGFRKAISCHYAAAECNYIDVTGTLHEKMANEIISTYKQKLGIEDSSIDYALIWKLRTRLVRGQEINL